jgi:hypothetical protein
MLHLVSIWVFAIAFALLAYMPSMRVDRYCELYSTSQFAPQPFNFWSNLAFFVASLITIKLATYRPKSLYFQLIPIVLLHLTLASATFHRVLSPLTLSWDLAAIILYLCVEFITSMYLLSTDFFSDGWSRCQMTFSVFVFIFVFFFVFLNANLRLYDESKNVLVMELLHICRKPPITWFKWIKLVSYMVALVFGTLSVWFWTIDDDGDGCEGLELLGHGLWHIFIAITILSLVCMRFGDEHM